MAKALASQALKLSPFQGEALLILAEASLYIAKASNNLSDLGSISRMIQDFQTRQWDYWGELGFYRLYFDFLRNDRSIDEKIESYLDGDPRLTVDHRHNVFIYRGRTQWKIMSRMCEQMVEKLGGGARASAFASSCFAREGRWDAARRRIETAVHQSPRDPLIQAWYAYVVKESGDSVQASIILGSATKANRRGEYSLPSLLQARFCQEKEDIDCARAAYKALFERDLNYLPALAGLAWVHAKRKTYAEASRFIETGLKISPDYIPLLVLRNQAEGDGWYGSK
jgi:tetratricopeptide (TPR) repeat protein